MIKKQVKPLKKRIVREVLVCPYCKAEVEGCTHYKCRKKFKEGDTMICMPISLSKSTVKFHECVRHTKNKDSQSYGFKINEK